MQQGVAKEHIGAIVLPNHRDRESIT